MWSDRLWVFVRDSLSVGNGPGKRVDFPAGSPLLTNQPASPRTGWRVLFLTCLVVTIGSGMLHAGTTRDLAALSMPEPATLVVVGAGIVGLALFSRRRRNGRH
jgi:PEP-CTERM motif-containing protein